MSVFTKAAAARTARLATVPTMAVAALAIAAAPALAEGTSVGITTYSGTVTDGQVTVSGAYQCTTDTPYDNVAVTAIQEGADGPVSSTVVEQVPCTGSTQTWQAALSPDQDDAWFESGETRIRVTLWAPGDWDGRAAASMVLWA